MARKEFNTGHGHGVAYKVDSENEIPKGNMNPGQIVDVNGTLSYLGADKSTLVPFSAGGGGGGTAYERWYVNPDYAGGDSDGSESKPFITTGAAVAAAASGDVIVCSAGLMIGDIGGVTIDKSLTIVGTGRSEQNTDISTYFASSFTIDTTAGDVTVSLIGITVFNGAGAFFTKAGGNVATVFVRDCDTNTSTATADKVYVYDSKISISGSAITGSTEIEFVNSEMAGNGAVTGGAVRFYNSRAANNIETATGTVVMKNSYVDGAVICPSGLLTLESSVVNGTILSSATEWITQGQDPYEEIHVDLNASINGNGRIVTPFNNFADAVTLRNSLSTATVLIRVHGVLSASETISGLTKATTIDLGAAFGDQVGGFGTAITCDNSARIEFMNANNQTNPAASEWTFTLNATNTGGSYYFVNGVKISVFSGSGANLASLWVEAHNCSESGFNIDVTCQRLIVRNCEGYFNGYADITELYGSVIRLQATQTVPTLTLDKSTVEVGTGTTVTVSTLFTSYGSFQHGPGTLDRTGATKDIEAPVAITT